MNIERNFPKAESAPVIHGLPDPFMGPEGGRILSPEQWPAQREYLKEMLEHYLFGHMPPPPGDTTGQAVQSTEKYGGAALEETIRISCAGGKAVFNATLLRPNKPGRFPVFVWLRMTGRGACPIERELVCERDYAIAMLDPNELAPDNEETFRSGPCGTIWPDYDWRCLAMWAWGQSRVADYLCAAPWADAGGLIATGHSRFGKASLWAGVTDERFALCAVPGSGCGGAGNFRHIGGRMGENIGSSEKLEDMARNFPRWLSANCLGFEGSRIHKLPVDLHFIRALIAPRPLLTLDGLNDAWANVYGVQVSWLAAQPVYEFLGAGDKNAIHFREGGHAYNETDWRAVLAFCQAMLRGGKKEGYKIYSPGADPEPAAFCGWNAPT